GHRHGRGGDRRARGDAGGVRDRAAATRKRIGGVAGVRTRATLLAVRGVMSDDARTRRSLMRTLRALTALISLALPGTAAAQSQLPPGVIDGTVVDASGGVLPGVDVAVKNVDTNLERNLVTDRDGRFVAPQLPPGRYTVTLKLAGFATLVQENVQVTVGQTVRLSLTMRVSAIAETVTVSATAETVDTARTAVANTL